MGCWESKSRLNNENEQYQNKNLKGINQEDKPVERLQKFESEYEVIGHLFMNPQKNIKKIVHKGSGKVLCMQVLKKDTSSEKTQAYFLKQIEILKTLDHDNIIKMFDSFNDGMSHYFITEFCNGGELFDKVVNSIYLQEKYACQIMEQVFSALDYCHKKNIGYLIKSFIYKII